MGNVLKKYNEEEEKWQVVGGAVTGDTLPIGTIIAYGSYNIPTGWLGCNGQAISRTVYGKLFSIIGTYFGEGDGSTTFNVPNLNNYSTPIGYVYGEEQSERGYIGTTGGAETHAMTIYELAPHTHNFNRTWGGSLSQDTSEKKVQAGYGDSSYWTDGVTESAGEGDPFSLMQPYVTTNYIIKAFQSSGVVANVAQEKTTSDIDTYSANYVNTLEQKIIELQNKIDNSVAYCSLYINDNQAFENDVGKRPSLYGNKENYGSFSVDVSKGCLIIPKGSAKTIETSGMLCGSGYGTFSIQIVDVNGTGLSGYSAQTNGLLIQQAGNGYWKASLPSTIVTLDDTKDWYIYLFGAGYNGQTCTLNNGFGYSACWFSAKKIR